MTGTLEYILPDLTFKRLPAFAGYIKQNESREFARLQLQLSRELNLPILQYFKQMTDQEIIELSSTENNTLLTSLSENNARQFIETSIDRWLKNQLPVVGRDNVNTSDLSLIIYIRKMSFLKLIPGYTSDLHEALELVEEIEKFSVEQQSISVKTYIELLNKRINEHVHFIERIAETSPGIIYVYDLLDKKQVYSNNKLKDLLGYSDEEVQHENGNFLDTIIHPQDIEEGAQYLEAFKDAKDGEIRSFKYRVKNKNGDYQWLRNYETVFKRNETGLPYQVIGIALNVDKEKRAAEQLQQREEQLLEAQEIAQLGSFTWNINNNTTTSTPLLLKLLALNKDEPILSFLRFVHSSDKQKVQDAIEKSINEKQNFECEFRYEKEQQTRWILLKGKVEGDELNCMKATVMDVTLQHSLLQRIQESEKLYKQAQTLTHIGNWKWDVKKNVVEWSDELHRIYGLTPGSEEITFEKVLSFVHPDDKQLLVDNVSKSLTRKEGYNIYHRLLLKDRSIKYVNGKGEILLDENGEPEFLFGTLQDITEQYNTQMLLEENQRYVEKITDAAPSLMIAYNVQTHKYNFVSKAVEKILGYEQKEVLREGSELFRRIIHPDDVLKIRQKNQEAIDYANENESIDKKDIAVEITFRAKHKNGKYRYLQTYGTILDRDENGKVEHMLNISMDITEKVEAEQKIQEQEHLIKHIADASPTILYVFDLELNKVVYINEEVDRLLNYTPNEIIALEANFFNTLFHPDEFEKIDIEHKKLVEGHHPEGLEYEVRMKHKSKGWRDVLLKEIIFKQDADTGVIKQVLCAALDITERKGMEKALYEKTLELHQSNKSLEEFAYVASHDLKEPLRKISAFGDRLVSSQQDKLDENGQFFLSKIMDSSRRMNVMIDDLLSLSMLSNKQEFEKYSLQTVLDEVLQTLEFKIEKLEAIITADHLPSLKIIPSQFRQLFQNLLSNALKFVSKDVQPVIKITCKYLTPAEVLIPKIASATRYIQLQFIDNGIGFDQEFADKIFVVFQRLHGRSEYEGTGIGLAICKKIMENHGGSIYANSTLGKGSTFTIVFPA